MHASSFYGRPMLEAESEQRRDEGPREEQPERKREREREETHALSKCATLCESWYARALVLPPFLLRFVRLANVTQATRFSPFFSSYPPPLTPSPLSKYRMSRVLSDHRQVDNLFGSRPPVRQKPTAMVYSSALFVARMLARVKQSDSYGVFE